MAKSKATSGRRKGSRNRGYFYRTGRGWFAKDQGRFVPLIDPAGLRLRDRECPVEVVRDAYARFRVEKRERDSAAITGPAETEPTILDVCLAYLAKAKLDGAEATYRSRCDTLFDFCFGLPPKFRARDGQPARAARPTDRLHEGFGGRPAMSLRPFDVDRWLQVHPRWTKGGIRSRIQAVKRAFNYAAESGLIAQSPLRGYKTPRPTSRVVYITPEQEASMLQAANPAFQLVLRLLIRTGARPGCELCKLTARHVRDHGHRMEWVFRPAESKTRALRTIRITDPEVIETVRGLRIRNPSGPLFRTRAGRPWTVRNMSERFRLLVRRLRRQGMEFDRGLCLYATRHTYAKRTLQGYWTGKVTNIETLARLMGNSPQVCRDHYLQWTETYNEPLWDAC